MKNKKWLLLLIIAFPSAFWLILETSTINSRKIPYYGPKKSLKAGDTTYFVSSAKFYPGDTSKALQPTELDTTTYPIYALIFLNKKYRGDAYRLTGLWEYLNYKQSKIEHIPFILVSQSNDGASATQQELEKLQGSKNVHFYTWPEKSYDSLTYGYFKEKPYYIDFSFFMLIDRQRHIRGYYDGRYVSEIKRLIDEYQHLRLKEEKQKLLKVNEIKQDTL